MTHTHNFDYYFWKANSPAHLTLFVGSIPLLSIRINGALVEALEQDRLGHFLTKIVQVAGNPLQ